MKKSIVTALLALVGLANGQAQQLSDTFTTPGGKTVKLTCIKHASIMIEYEGMVFYVDPVSGLEPQTDFSQWPKARYILITHEHNDHFDRQAIAALRNQGTMIYENKAVYDIFHNGVPMANGDSLMLANDITLKAVPAYNTTPGREKFHPKGRDNGYVLQLDGLRIYIAGDTEDIPEMSQLSNIDIAFLPCNQPYTMTVEQLVRAANVIKPKVLFPYHYNNTPVHQASMELVGSGIDVRIRPYR
jgi:L-ascorbate metabolism protein UlaG (beta-lactamase superfamily)